MCSYARRSNREFVSVIGSGHGLSPISIFRSSSRGSRGSSSKSVSVMGAGHGLSPVSMFRRHILQDACGPPPARLPPPRAIPWHRSRNAVHALDATIRLRSITVAEAYSNCSSREGSHAQPLRTCTSTQNRRHRCFGHRIILQLFFNTQAQPEIRFRDNSRRTAPHLEAVKMLNARDNQPISTLRHPRELGAIRS
jgi:hypothetical protein